jgi:cytochrome oxidase assembly protein ShyY1
MLSRRWILFFVTVALLAYLAIRLGEWQFHRLEDREQENAVIRKNLDAPPVPVEEVLAVGRPVPADQEWRHVTARGEYLDEESVVVRYQTQDGQSGVDVVTPLRTEDGPALLVNRGWLETGNVGTTTPDVPPAPEGEVAVTGWVRADATGDSTAVDDRSTRAVSSVAIGATLPFPVYGGFVELDRERPSAAEPLVKVEPPDLGEGPHFFYGLQWWFFAALAIFGFCYLAWDERRKLRRSADPEASPRQSTPARR